MTREEWYEATKERITEIQTLIELCNAGQTQVLVKRPNQPPMLLDIEESKRELLDKLVRKVLLLKDYEKAPKEAAKNWRYHDTSHQKLMTCVYRDLVSLTDDDISDTNTWPSILTIIEFLSADLHKPISYVLERFTDEMKWMNSQSYDILMQYMNHAPKLLRFPVTYTVQLSDLY